MSRPQRIIAAGTRYTSGGQRVATADVATCSCCGSPCNAPSCGGMSAPSTLRLTFSGLSACPGCVARVTSSYVLDGTWDLTCFTPTPGLSDGGTWWLDTALGRNIGSVATKYSTSDCTGSVYAEYDLLRIQGFFTLASSVLKINAVLDSSTVAVDYLSLFYCEIDVPDCPADFTSGSFNDGRTTATSVNPRSCGNGVPADIVMNTGGSVAGTWIP